MSLKKFLFIVSLFLIIGLVSHAVTIYVDDDAPGDPGPGDVYLSDPFEDGSEEHPYDAINEAILYAVDGDIVLLAEGTHSLSHWYPTGLVISNKAITVRGQSGAENCVVDATGLERCFVIGSNFPITIEGLTITGASSVGIVATQNVIIKNCRILGGSEQKLPLSRGIQVSGNNVQILGTSVESFGDWGIWSYRGAFLIDRCTIRGHIQQGIHTEESSAVIRNTLVYENGPLGLSLNGAVQDTILVTNCTVAGHGGDSVGGSVPTGLAVSGSVFVVVENSIFWNDVLEIASTGATLTVRYCNVRGGFTGVGNIDTWPMFADQTGGDYHLLEHSPSQNTGNPDFIPSVDEMDIDNQPRVIYGRVDMGCDEAVYRDYSDDGVIDMEDLILFSGHWMETGCHEPDWCGLADLSLDGRVGLEDWTILIERWLVDTSLSIEQ
ncbi:MAG: right-handed parallel beta-helix repeat-containing protein [Sedimentisphaerales bacterium]|nr:right-handed parallel beta-helix repeat-containing protein [Sedimentisphaerales bacterium]